MAKANKPAKIQRVLIDLPIDISRTLRTIAENKGFNKKNYIEEMCRREAEQFTSKQKKLL